MVHDVGAWLMESERGTAWLQLDSLYMYHLSSELSVATSD